MDGDDVLHCKRKVMDDEAPQIVVMTARDLSLDQVHDAMDGGAAMAGGADAVLGIPATACCMHPRSAEKGRGRGWQGGLPTANTASTDHPC